MAKRPVFRGSSPKPLWIRRNGVLVPAWADEDAPCDDCCGQCQTCLDSVFCLDLEVSGYVDYGPFLFGASGTNQFYEFFLANLNRTYRLNRGNDPELFPPYFFVDVGTQGDPNDPGILTAEFRDEDTGFWARMYNWRLIARAACFVDDDQVEKIRIIANWVKQGFDSNGQPGDLAGCAGQFAFTDLPESKRKWQEMCAELLRAEGMFDVCPQCPDIAFQGEVGDFPQCVEVKWKLACFNDPCELPTVLLTLTPPQQTLETNATFDWQTTGEEVTTTCELDGNVASCTAPLTYSNLSPGIHEFKVTTLNDCGQDTQTYIWEILGEPEPCVPPSLGLMQTPTGSQGESTTSTTATFGWFTNGTVRQMRVTLDGGTPQIVAGNTITFTNLATNQFHNVTIVADSLECGQAQQGWTWFITGAPLQPPTVDITQGPANPTQSTSANFVWVRGGGPIASQTIQLDGGTPIELGGNTHSYPGPISLGPHVFRVNVANSAGSDFDEWEWTVVEPQPGQPPTVTITEAPDDPTTDRNALLRWVTGGGPVDLTEVSLDGGPFVPFVGNTKDYTNLAIGQHIFVVRVSNQFGSDSDFHIWNINALTPCEELLQLLRIENGTTNVDVEITLNGVVSTNCDGPGWNGTYLITAPALVLGACPNTRVNDSIGITACNIALPNSEQTVSWLMCASCGPGPYISVTPAFAMPAPGYNGGATFELQGNDAIAMFQQLRQTGVGQIPFANYGTSAPPPAGFPVFDFTNATCTMRILP